MKKIQITARTRAPEPITQSVIDKAVERGKMRQNTDKALRLADDLDRGWAYKTECAEAAAELRRLSEIETLYLAAMRGRHAMSEELPALTTQRDLLLEKIKAVIAAEQSEGRGRGGFVNTPPTREHQRRVAQAWQELHTAIKAVEENI